VRAQRVDLPWMVRVQPPHPATIFPERGYES